MFELFSITDGIRDAIAQGRSKSDLRALASEGGMPTLRQDAWAKVASTVTTVEEVVRAVDA